MSNYKANITKKIIATFNNTDYGIKSYVVIGNNGGFKVSLEDTDAAEFLGITYSYKTEDKAIAKAQELVA